MVSVTKNCFHLEHIRKNCADINSINSFNSLFGILLPLFATIHPPVLVIHIFVAFGDGFPLEIWT